MNDKVKFQKADAMILEETLQKVLNKLSEKDVYKESNTRKAINRHSDQVQPKRTTTDVLNDAVAISNQINKRLK